MQHSSVVSSRSVLPRHLGSGLSPEFGVLLLAPPVGDERSFGALPTWRICTLAEGASDLARTAAKVIASGISAET
jgi:hypothetical protein